MDVLALQGYCHYLTDLKSDFRVMACGKKLLQFQYHCQIYRFAGSLIQLHVEWDLFIFCQTKFKVLYSAYCKHQEVEMQKQFFLLCTRGYCSCSSPCVTKTPESTGFHSIQSRQQQISVITRPSVDECVQVKSAARMKNGRLPSLGGWWERWLEGRWNVISKTALAQV